MAKYDYWITDEGKTLLEGWAKEGLLDADIAKKIGIARTTLYAWKKQHPDIDDALKKGKEVIDYEVENALLKRALGYAVEETTKEFVGGEMRVTKSVIKHFAPDTTAQIFWLKNRKPIKWRDRREVDASIGEISKVDQMLEAIDDEAKS